MRIFMIHLSCRVTTLVVESYWYPRSGVGWIAIGANSALNVTQLAGRRTFRVEKASPELRTDVHRAGQITRTCNNLDLLHDDGKRRLRDCAGHGKAQAENGTARS